MTPGTVILNLAKASPDDFLAGLKSLSNQERVEVDRKMRQLEDKHQDEFSKDSGRREQTRRGFLSTLGLGAAGIGAAVASKLLPGGKVVGKPADDVPLAAVAKPEPSQADSAVAKLTAKQEEFVNPMVRVGAERGEHFDDELAETVGAYNFDGGQADAEWLRSVQSKSRLNRDEMKEFTSILGRAQKRVDAVGGFNSSKYDIENFYNSSLGSSVARWKDRLRDVLADPEEFKAWHKREAGNTDPSRMLGDNVGDVIPLMRPKVWELAGVEMPKWMQGIQERYSAINDILAQRGEPSLDDSYTYSTNTKWLANTDGYLGENTSLEDDLFGPVNEDPGFEGYVRDMIRILPKLTQATNVAHEAIHPRVLNNYIKAVGQGYQEAQG